MEREILVSVRNLSHRFRLNRHAFVRAVDDVSLDIRRGEIFGLVGESGSGKSTLAKLIMNVYRPNAGRIFYNGIDITNRAEFRKHRKELQKNRQIIFQDSASSLNPRMTAAEIIAEPMMIHHMVKTEKTAYAEAKFQLANVGMDAKYLDQYPPEMSGGQRQRVSIARALSMEPEFLVADEPIASLDVSIQASIINLFKHLQQEHGFTFLFIAHDLAMVEYLCDRVGVMYQGKLVEMGDTKSVYENPLHPYTQSLISAIPVPDPIRERARKHVPFDESLFDRNGEMREMEPGHFVLSGKGAAE